MISISKDMLARFCRQYHIRRLALFGSVLCDDFRADSDVDVLVDFESGHTPDFFRLYELEEELSTIFSGHRIDLVTYNALNPHLRDHILATAIIQYEQR